MRAIGMIIMIMSIIAVNCRAATHYVVTNGTPGWIGAADPYTNWATAGTNIIDVVNTAMTNPAARVVWVTNGTYNLTNAIAATNALTIQSVNGRNATMLAGQGAYRCASFDIIAGSVFNGFTVSNFQRGGIYSTNALSVLNCLFVGNSNGTSGTGRGGGVDIYNYSTGIIVTNCIFSNNYARTCGGGMALGNSQGALAPKIYGCYFHGNICDNTASLGCLGGGLEITGGNCIISNCIFVNNFHAYYGGGGGIYGGSGNQITDCLIVSNGATYGAGIELSYGSGIIIKNCSIVSNTAATSGGGICRIESQGPTSIKGCLIARNSANGQKGGGVYLTNGTIDSCTIVSNYAAVSGGGLYIKDVGSGTNNIIYFNTAPSSANFTNTAGNTGLHYSCVIPAVDGTRNITNDPSLVNLSGNYRLNDNSPCVNAGLNKDWMTNAVDLDGRQRIRYGTVDMGAFEGICGGTIYGFH